MGRSADMYADSSSSSDGTGGFWFCTQMERTIVGHQRETSKNLYELRAQLVGPARRIECAEAFKAEANDSFAAGDMQMALRLYVTALWLLKEGEPSVPAALSAESS